MSLITMRGASVNPSVPTRILNIRSLVSRVVSPASWSDAQGRTITRNLTAWKFERRSSGSKQKSSNFGVIKSALLVDFSTEVKQIENLALQLARQAGARIREKSGNALKVESKSSRTDLVTEIDKECEELIYSEVKNTFPEHLWLGEETVTVEKLEALGADPDSTEWTWIVDPIDGTSNFIGGLPFASVSIAVARGSSVEVGVIYNPFIDELFQATKGHGAFVNGRKIAALARDTELEDAIITVGFTSKPDRRKLMLEATSKVGPHCRAIRAFGSAALHICYVAAGRVGCFMELALKPWDISAARLVLEEAGGYVSGMDGKPVPLAGGSILATNGGKLHDRIVQLLQ